MKSVKYMLVAVGVLALAGSGLMLRAQEATPLEKQLKNVPGVPAEALLTERGRELAFELKNLLRSKNGMGPRHPSLPDVEKRIEATRELLKAYAPAENPFKKKDGGGDQPEKMLNEYDLRQLVLRLSKRVEQLEKRVAKLEGKN